MLLAAGLPAPDGAALRVLEVLAQRGVFRAGGVLVGSHAFAAYGPMLGVQWSAAWQTADVDIASAPDIRIAVEADADLPAALVEANPRFLPVPGLDPRTPSTSFKVRGRSLRVDVVTPLVGEPGHGPVFSKALNVAAQPVRFLDYLIEAHQPAALVGRSGVLVNVPVPARFAVHELLVAQSRPVSDHAKVRKDLQEAEQLIAVLAEDRPGDLGRAWRAACDRGPGWKKRVEAGAARLSVDARRALGE
ncbi:MAG: nucleotidyltransferase domain-containing protein [Myxococcales bacterium]|nr:nucleotidyltransferase domain-containing protein [Myxococcales bacterium]